MFSLEMRVVRPDSQLPVEKKGATKHLGEIEQREASRAAVTATQTTANVLSSAD